MNPSREMRVFGIGPTEHLAVLVFGSNRLPAMGTGLGKAIHDFRKAASGQTGEPAPRRIEKFE